MARLDRLGDEGKRTVQMASVIGWQQGEVWEKAIAQSAHREAVGYFEQALSALPHLLEQQKAYVLRSMRLNPWERNPCVSASNLCLHPT